MFRDFRVQEERKLPVLGQFVLEPSRMAEGVGPGWMVLLRSVTLGRAGSTTASTFNTRPSLRVMWAVILSPACNAETSLASVASLSSSLLSARESPAGAKRIPFTSRPSHLVQPGPDQCGLSIAGME